MADTQKDQSNKLLMGVLLFTAVLIAGLFARRFAFFILFALAVATFIGVVLFFIRHALQGKHRRSLEGKIEELRSECSEQIKKLRHEIAEIQVNILELDNQMNSGQNLNPRTQAESVRILAGFHKEQQLRETKISFYDTCRSKLENMLYNQRMAKQLEEKQKKLSQLQEAHHEDIARMEQLRTEVAYEKDFLESIGALSLKMAEINSLDTAEELQLELKEITKELRRL